MKIKLQFCFFLIMQVFIMQSQQFNWATNVTGGQYEYGIKSVKDTQGNTYIIGYSTGNPFEYEGESYHTNGRGDAFFAKLDTNKELVWMKSIGADDSSYYDFATDIHIDPFGDIYIAFKSSGDNFTYDGQVLEGINSPGQFGGEAVLVKVDANGNYIWHDSGTVDSYFQAITTDSSGNVYITGSFDTSITLGGTITLTNPSTFTTNDMLVAKYQPDGTILWAKNAGGMPHNTFAYGFDIEINPQTNEVIVLGKGEGEVFFDGVPMPIYAGSNEGIVLISYTINGTQNWIKRVLNVQNAWYSYGNSLDISNSGTIGVCGYTNNTGLVGFYNSNGIAITEHSYPSANQLRIYSISFNEFNEAYISGWCTDGTLGISPGTVTLSSLTGFIAKIDIFQQVRWVEEFEATGTSNQIHYDNGTLTYAGRIDANFIYNSGQNVITNNLGDALFGEIIDYQLPLNLVSYLSEDCLVYPNPTAGHLVIEANALQQVNVYTISGTLMESFNKNQFDLNQYPKGIYFLKITTDKGTTYKKVVLK